MRPVSAEFPINQPFGSMKTAGVVGNINRPNTVEYYVARYGNYQPYGHAGADFKCPEGTPVYAIASGTVLWADWGTRLPGDETNLGYRRRWYLYKSFPGIVTVIQHPGWIGVYAHLSSAPLNIGDRVTEGQQIALSGGTGGVAPHLHVEALIDLTYKTGGGLIYGRTNPEPYFGGLAAMGGTITPLSEEDDMAYSEADLKRIIAEAVQPAHDVTRQNVVDELTLRTEAQHVATRSTVVEGTQAQQDVTRGYLADRVKEASPVDLAVQINAAGIAAEVRDELVKLLSK